MTLPRLLPGLLSALLLACGSDSDPGPSSPAPPSTASPAGTTDFARLGFAVAFRQGCGDCHDSQAGLGGLAFTDLPPDEMRATLIATRSRVVPSMPLVTPGDPDASFLMLKLRGDFSPIDCTQVACGSPMPLANYPFAEGDRIDFEQWIRDGAR